MVKKYLVLCDHCLQEIADQEYHIVHNVDSTGLSWHEYELHANCLHVWAEARAQNLLDTLKQRIKDPR